MGINAGPNIVRDSSLTLQLDAADLNSYVTSSTVWRDLAVGAYNGTLTNGPSYSSINGGCIVFDGINDNINLGAQNATSSLSTFGVTENFTILSWINIDDYSVDHGIFGKTPSVYPSPYLFQINSGSGFLLAARGNGSTTSGSYTNSVAVSTGSWQHIGLSISIPSAGARQANFYINAIPSGAGSVAATVQNSTSVNIRIGTRNNGSTPFKGKMGLIQFYNKVLSDSEILQNYNAQKSRFGL